MQGFMAIYCTMDKTFGDKMGTAQQYMQVIARFSHPLFNHAWNNLDFAFC